MSSAVIDRESGLAPAKSRPRLAGKRLAILGAALCVGLVAAWYGHEWWTVGRFIESTDDAYVGGDVTVIAPKVAGFIAEVAVTDNQAVHAGDLLVKLDDRDYRAALAKAEAAVAGQQATLANLEATRRLQQALIAEAAGRDRRRRRRDRPCPRRSGPLAPARRPMPPPPSRPSQKGDADLQGSARRRRQGAGGASMRRERQLEVIDTQKQQTRAALDAALSPTARRRSSTSATPSCGRRSTGPSATAAPVPALSPPSARSCCRSCRRRVSGSTPTSRRTSSRACAPGSR